MKKYDILILNELLNKYEHSKLSKEGSTRNLKITIKSNHSILKDYWSEESYLFRDQINMILDALVKQDFVSIKRNKDRELESINLNVDIVSSIYKLLKRQNPEEERTEILQYLESLESTNNIILNFISNIIEKLKSFQSVLSYFESLDSLKLYITAIETMSLLEEDTLKRNFSKKIFNDSKLFERIENKVLKIIKEFSESDIEDNVELLAEYHLVKTPTFAYIKGRLTIKVNSQLIDLSDFGHELALSSSALLDLEIINVKVKKVLTIENLTTFVSFDNSDYVVIFLAGFHNSVKRALLRKLNEHNKSIEFFHFGDIDAGGLLIFDDLVSKTGLSFKPYMMDVSTLEKYKDNWINLTHNDKMRLQKNSNIDFNELVKYMIENNCKLEQEAIDIKTMQIEVIL
jgi:hypothetical protein